MAWRGPWRSRAARRSPALPERGAEGAPLEGPAALPRERPPALGMAAVVDVETTGLSPTRDEIVEMALILFVFDRATGEIQGVVEEYAGLREPSVPISDAAARVNGITWEQVRGRRLDEARIEGMLRRAEFLVAHNASFDRSFVTRLFPLAAQKPWLCSMRSVNWRGIGFRSAALQELLRHHGIRSEQAHRGASDARATLELLGRRGPDGHPYFYWLLHSGRAETGGAGQERPRHRRW